MPFVAAAGLNTLALKLSPIAVLFLVGYSFTKRFTVLAHWVLGFTDALAVGGGWIAVRGSFFAAYDLPAWLLVAAVTFWIAGFDLIYACQDVEFDRRAALHSVPARMGVPAALFMALVRSLTRAFAQQYYSVNWADLLDKDSEKRTARGEGRRRIA